MSSIEADHYRYRVIREIGRGSTGIVYEAEDQLLNERVAMKTLRASDPNSLYRLKREFRSLVDLDHPNLVELYDLVVDQRAAFFTMELVHGVDFLSYCRPEAERARASGGPQHPRDVRPPQVAPSTRVLTTAGHEAPTERAPTELQRGAHPRLRDALAQLVDGVDALHRAGKLHRDIKPSNALVTPVGRVKLLDFGLVLDIEAPANDPSSGTIVGTVAYMSPEQADTSVDLGPASDWYSVGVLLFAVLTGRLPFSGDAVQIVLAKERLKPPSPRRLVASVPRDLDELCVRLLAPRPEDRPNAQDILQCLRARPAERHIDRPDRRPSFTGRSRELAVLSRALDSVRRGQTKIILLTGESGMGKSALAREFIAHCNNAIVLGGRCFERESVPYQAVDRPIDELALLWNRLPAADAASLVPRNAHALLELFPVLRRVNTLADESGRLRAYDPQDRRTQAFAALREVLTHLGARQPIVLFLDDMQWVDADTVELLVDVLRPPDPPALLLLLAARPANEAGPSLVKLLNQLGPSVTSLVVAPMAATEAAAMATRILGRHQAELTSRIVAQAGGIPFFIAELSRHSQGVVRSDPSTVSVANVVQQRVLELSDDSQRLLELLAVANEPLSSEMAVSAARIAPGLRERTLRLLERRSLIRKLKRDKEALELYHDRLRSAISVELPAATTVAHHRTLASVLSAFDEGSAAQRARHWLGAREPLRALPYLLRAAEEASDTLAFDRAAAFYARALNVGHLAAEQRRATELRLATSLARAARGPEAAEAYLRVAEGAEHDVRLTCEQRAAEQWLISGHIERGMDVVNHLLGRYGGLLPRSRSYALASIILNRILLKLFGYRWREKSEAQLSRQEVTRLDVYRIVSQVVGMVDPLRGTDLQVRQLRMSLKSGEPFRVARAFLAEATYRSTQGQKNRPLIAWLLGEARQVAERLQHDYLLAVTLGSEGFVHYSFGEFEQAYEVSTRADDFFEQRDIDGTWERNTLRFVRLWSLLRMARFDGLRVLYDRFVREASRRGDRYTETTLRRSVNRLWMVYDNVPGARADLDRTTWEVPEGRFHLQHWFSLRAKGELALYERCPEMVGADASEFTAIARSMLTRVQFIRTESRWLRARLMLAERRRGTQARKLGRALQNEDAPYSRVWGLLTEAAALHQLANDEEAADRLRRAVAASNAVRMHLCEQAAHYRLGHLIRGSIGAAMIDGAVRKLEAMGIRAPTSILQVIAPGFDEP